MCNNPNWYSIAAKPEEKAADVMIYDAIGGFGVSADAFVKELRGIKAKTINLHLNTPGGEVFHGAAIYHALKAHPAHIVVHIDGVAASAGSFVAMAGDEIRIAKNAFMMVHNARTGLMGTSADMRRAADMCDKITANMTQMYAERTGRPAEEWKALMEKETWFTAEEAVEYGLADSIDETDAVRVTAQWDIGIFASAPDQLKQAWEKQQTTAAKVASSDAPGTASITENSMKLEDFKAFAASNPEAVEALTAPRIEAFKAEANKPATVNELRAAFPDAGDNGFVIDQLAANATLSAAKVAYNAVLADRLNAATAKNTELEAALAKSNAGFQGVGIAPIATAAVTSAKPDESDPKALASWEWDNLKPQGFSTKDRYVAIRTAELKGQFRMYSGTAKPAPASN